MLFIDQFCHCFPCRMCFSKQTMSDIPGQPDNTRSHTFQHIIENSVCRKWGEILCNLLATSRIKWTWHTRPLRKHSEKEYRSRIQSVFSRDYRDIRVQNTHRDIKTTVQSFTYQHMTTVAPILTLHISYISYNPTTVRPPSFCEED